MDEPDYEGYVPPPPFAPPGERRDPLPLYGPPPYGPPPPYGAPPLYGPPPQYPPPPYYPPPYGPPPQYAPLPTGVVLGPDGLVTLVPESRRRRTLGIVAVVLAVLAICVGGGAYLADKNSDSGSGRLAVPEAFAGYQRLHNALSQQVESAMRQLGGTTGIAGGIFNVATIGSYARNSGDAPRLIVFALRTSDLPPAVRSGNAFITGMSAVLTAPTSYPSARHGGTTECGTAQFGSVAETACTWSDPKTSGMLVDVLEGLGPAQLDRTTESLRDAVE